MDYRIRQYLPHQRPDWVSEHDPLFITICHKQRGIRHFDNPFAWGVVLAAAQHLEAQGKWRPLALLAMPDHLHGVVRIGHAHPIQSVIGSFKRDIGHALPTHWQRDGFDHRLRNHEHLMEALEYVAQNPVKAGFVATSDLWPFQASWEERNEG